MKTAVINNGISGDLETCCRTLREDGIGCVEIQRVDEVPVELCTPEQAVAWRRICDRHAVSAVCVTTHAFGGVPVDSVEVGDSVYQRHYEMLRNGMAIARELGARFVRSQTFTKAIVTWGHHGAEQWMANNNSAWTKFLTLFEPVVELAETMGIDLLVETCFNSMNSTAALNRRLVDDMGSKRLKLLWDPCNALLFHEFPSLEVYESVKDIIGHIHIKDAVVDTTRATVDFRPLGRGMIAPYLDDLAAALRRDQFDGCVSLESVYKPDGGDDLDGYRANLPRFLHTFS